MPDNHVKPKVLVVDDERVIADTLAMILNQSGFQATAVYSGEAAYGNFGQSRTISDAGVPAAVSRDQPEVSEQHDAS